ncbi:DUF4232 domain-containing protein [Streptomyces sp. NPDC007100]|uniref:DUF4232 domain-containing protein n=1 Tax=Streptomyces sp. NPDC007100 TaxID=3155602 RepID=UPI0033ECB114
MRSRLFTTRTARIAASAAAVAAALSLTACGGAEDGKKAAGADRPAASPGPDSAAGSAPVDGADGSDGTGGMGGTGPSAKAPSGAGTHAAPAKTGSGGKHHAAPNGKSSTTCTPANTKVTVSKLSRPINHLLLTVTNTGSTRCDAYYYPALRFDDAQAPTAVMEDSRPQAVVSVEPGRSAYAAVRASDPTGEADGGKTAHRLQVFFANRDGGYGDRSTRLTLPKDTYIDDSAKVTYWQTELDDAL